MAELDPTRQTDYEVIHSPAMEVDTSAGKYELHWHNCLLVSEPNGYQYARIFHKKDDIEATMMDYDFDLLTSMHFPHQFNHNPQAYDKDDFIEAKFWEKKEDGGSKKSVYKFRPDDTTIRLFTNEKYNHIEKTYDNGNTIGVQAPDYLLQDMFRQGYPILFLPYVDKGTKDWYKEHIVTRSNDE